MKIKIYLILVASLTLLQLHAKNPRKFVGTQIVPIENITSYSDNRPSVKFRIGASDAGVVFKHGNGPDSCDYLGARDVWVWKYKRKFYMHYDGAGPKGWLTSLATSKDLKEWKTFGNAVDLGDPSTQDRASAAYGTTYFDGKKWHMFYLGTPNVSPAPNFIPIFPYLNMKAEATSPVGPWTKRYDIIPFEPKKNSYYSGCISPGQIVKNGNEYLMFFSASTDYPEVMRTISIARTTDLDGKWSIDEQPILPAEEQIENTSLYYEKSIKTWFLFTNHVGIKDGLEYTDAIWVYWTKDLNAWNPANKAVVVDGSTSNWSKHIIGLPSVLKVGNRLAVFYDGNAAINMPQDIDSHMKRDVGLAWVKLPIVLPAK